jgi:molybdopterin-guanine dinucleotide biosynthesis protein A
MGGVDKAHLTIQGKTILDRVVAVLMPHCSPIALVGRDFAPAPLVALPDPALDGQEARQGPLAGILAALLRAPGDYVMIVPCDTPFLPDDLVPRLWQAARPDVGVVTAATGQWDHPTIALWRTDLAPVLSAAFDAGTRSIRAFTKTIPHALVHWQEGGLDPFTNVNTPQDLADALLLAEPMR